MYYAGLGVIVAGLLFLVYCYNPESIPVLHNPRRDALFIGMVLCGLGMLTVFVYRER